MPTSHENALQQRCQQIVTSPVLSPEQKRHFLALEAENNLPYPQLPAEARRALDEGVICDMSCAVQTALCLTRLRPFSGARFRMAGAGRRERP